MPGGDAIARRINELMRSGGYDLVVATRDWHPPDHGSFTAQGGIWPVHCVQDTEGAQLHPDLDAAAVDVIVDKGQDPDTEGYSGFDGTRLAELLRERGIDQLTVVGLATDYCVKQTALEALQEGFGVTVDRPPCAASTSSRATPTARWPSCGPRARSWREAVPARPRLVRSCAAGRRRARPAAIAAVPRDAFVPPEDLRDEAWDNEPLPIGCGPDDLPAARRRPHVRAARARGGERVLDVGTGSGYHAALLARLGARGLQRRAARGAVRARAARALAAAGATT